MQEAIDITTKLNELKPILTDRFNVSKIGFFGSYATGDQTEKSDLDLLVEFSRPIGWEFFTLEGFLEKEFGLSVDLVTIDALKARTKNRILNQVIYI